MEEFIPEPMKDSVFFYAKEVVCERESNRWMIKVDPDSCLVRNPDADVDVDLGRENSDETIPDVPEIRSQEPDKTEKGSQTVYSGRILFSAGFVVMIDGRIALTQRGPGASVDPCKWTSPAGRCDSTPSDTATRELYEELVVLADGRPAFLTVDTSSMGSKSLYLDTLRRNGIHAGKNDLVYLDAELPDRYRSMTATVETRFGRGDGGDVECYFGEFWPLYDPSASTLELRRIVEVTVPEDVSSVSFSDGEYGQPTRLFGRDDFVNTDPDEFVRTDRALREKVIEGN